MASRGRRPLADAVHASAPAPPRTATGRRRRPHGSGDARRTAASRAQSQPGSIAASSSCSRSFWNSFSLIQSGMRHPERAEAPRRERQVGLEQPLELQERLVVEDDVVELGRASRRPRPGSSRSHCAGKPASCFLRVKRSSCAAATMLAVDDQRGGAVVIEGRDAEDAHELPLVGCGPDPATAATGRMTSELVLHAVSGRSRRLAHDPVGLAFRGRSSVAAGRRRAGA